MSERYNCPNCGAPIGYSPHCQYCGTLLNWIPFIAACFTAEPRNIRKLVGKVMFTRNNILGLGEEVVQHLAEQQLAEQFARKIPDVWEVKVEDDPIIDGKDYRATLYVYAKEDKE